MTKAKEIDAILSRLDPILETLGFRRRKRDREWSRTHDEMHRDFLHLNFGLGLIGPSMAVEYLDLVDRLPPEYGRFLSMTPLQSLLSPPKLFDLEMPFEELASEIVKKGIPHFEKLHDRHFVIQSLAVDDPQNWPAASYSDRIRLLPLLLATSCRVAEARKFVEDHVVDSNRRDQRLPNYRAFANWFLSTFQA
jgi:hypothetical protein